MKATYSLAAGALALCMASTSLAAPQPPPNNGFLGIYGDAAGTQCCVTVAPFTSGNLFLIATTARATSHGVTGGEFRLEISAPTGYGFSYTSPTGSTALGNPMDDTPSNPSDSKGMNLAFSTCRPAAGTGMAGDRINLGSIMVFNISGQPCDLMIKRKNPPSNPDFKGPLFTLCDAPAFTKVSMTLVEGDPNLYGQEPIASIASLNKPGCSPTGCGFVAVEQKSWGGIKEFYR